MIEGIYIPNEYEIFREKTFNGKLADIDKDASVSSYKRELETWRNSKFMFGKDLTFFVGGFGTVFKYKMKDNVILTKKTNGIELGEMTLQEDGKIVLKNPKGDTFILVKGN